MAEARISPAGSGRLVSQPQQPAQTALVSAVTGYLCYFGHELIWSRIAWGRHNGLK